jgi:hypothetical protein
VLGRGQAATIAIVAALAAVPAAAGAAAPRITRIWLGERVDGTRGAEGLRGRALIETPRAWRHINHDAAPTAHFTARSGAGCAAKVDVSGRAVATRANARAQARQATRSPAAVIGEGSRPRGAWRAVQLAPSQDRTGESPPDVYGIAVVRIARRRFVHVRAFALFDPACTTSQIRSGPVASALNRLLRRARVEARIVAAHR